MTSGASTGVTGMTLSGLKEARDAALATGAMEGMNRAFELLDELLDALR